MFTKFIKFFKKDYQSDEDKRQELLKWFDQPSYVRWGGTQLNEGFTYEELDSVVKQSGRRVFQVNPRTLDYINTLDYTETYTTLHGDVCKYRFTTITDIYTIPDNFIGLTPFSMIDANRIGAGTITSHTIGKVKIG